MKFRPRQNISLIPFIICKQQNRDFLLNNHEPSLRSRSVLWRRSSFFVFLFGFFGPIPGGEWGRKDQKEKRKRKNDAKEQNGCEGG